MPGMQVLQVWQDQLVWSRSSYPGQGSHAGRYCSIPMQGTRHLPLRAYSICLGKMAVPGLTLPVVQMGTSTFSQYTVVSDVSIVAVNPKAPLDKACLLGCGITTGFGAITKTPGIGEWIFPGVDLSLILNRTTLENSNVAVFGVGCVGLSILQGARAKKCAKVIAIDVNNGKKETALKFGASEPLFLSLSNKGANIQLSRLHQPQGASGGTEHRRQVD